MMDVREQELNRIVSEGTYKVESVLQDIQEEFRLRRDIIVKPDALNFNVNGGITVDILGHDEPFNFTGHAKSQLLARAGIPVQYADKLIDLGETDLLTENLNKMSRRLFPDGAMMRHINKEIRAVLSNKYKRRDASLYFENFLTATRNAGYVPYTGTLSSKWYNIAMILPQVYNPREGEYLVFGISIQTSDYGAGALKIELVVLRISCRNLMKGMSAMRSIHSGTRYNTEEDMVELSDQTLELDNQTTLSAMSDIIGNSINLQAEIKNRIESSMVEGGVDINDEIKKMRAKGFRKEFAESVKAVYETSLPVEQLPQQDSRWRLSNVISLLANGSSVDSDVKLDAQNYAMDILS